MSSNISQAEDELICGICHRAFDDPRLLPCLHTFCAKCIEEVDPYAMGERSFQTPLSSQSTGYSSQRLSAEISLQPVTILCPKCDTEVTIPRRTELLPVNHLIRNKLFLQNLSSPKASIHCDLCTGNQEAITRCSICHENLCDICTKAHKRQRRTSSHAILTLKDIRRLKPTNQIKRHIMCPFHDDEMKLYCETCDRLACRDCLLVDHKDHRYGFTNEVMNDQLKQLKENLERLKPFKDTVKTSLRNVQTMREKIDRRADVLEKEVNQFIDAYVKALEKYRTKIVGRIETICNKKVKALKLQKIQLEQNLDDIFHTCRFTEELLAEGSAVEVLHCKKDVQARLNELVSKPYASEPKADDFVEFCPSERGEVINGYKLYGAISSKCVDAVRSTITGEGLHTPREGHKTELILLTKDQEGQPMGKGGADISAKMAAKDNAEVIIPVHIRDRRDGNYVISYTPDRPGQFSLNITIKGKPIKDAPFNVAVKARWRKHTGTFHCCTFCSSGGRKDVVCGCGSVMPGGFQGCGHGHSGHPGRQHWSCCGKLSKNSECSKPYHGVVQQFTL
ncbi:E3 ubiquitin-protein ligase TRIM45-like [Lineus longissimus]|uniref:E3 ubiquitin-protein ligase TRIM45-like n=1 Tax=Lineus longissimus TaxID=88925 RepID=UPI002B4F869F